MAELKSKKRKSLRDSQFALPEQRKYPVHDCSHAANAKARASQMTSKGHLSKSARDRVFAKANKKLESC